MECNIARKKLKDYVQNNITDIKEKNILEKHIKNCAICKRELYLWQEVLEKQKVISYHQSNLSSDIRERIKYRMTQIEKDKFLPPTVYRLQAISKIWSSTKGRLIIQILIILVSLIVIIKYMHGGKNLIVPFLILFGFIVLFIIMLKGRIEK
ncbi:MAG: hypothetical protein N2114_05825 [Candidatus Goldbacteria bacterium]|nr:hypothetical protein [Candidatus Goldiibacteriota bacterium]